MPSERAEIILIVIAGTVIVVVLTFFILLFVIYYKRKARIQREEKEKMASHFRQEILLTQLEIQEQTLKNISQEIHDNIGQALTLAKLNLNTMLPVTDDQLEQKIINSKELVGKAISDLRSLSHSLDTDYVQEMGLQRAIEYELEMIRKSDVLGTVFEVQGNPFRLNKQKELILFRITQESFNNILKHAEASSIKVVMNYSPLSLEMQISDNGKGIDLSGFSLENAGLGIRNMNSRTQLIGASFQMESVPQLGTMIKIFLPVEKNSHEDKQ